MRKSRKTNMQLWLQNIQIPEQLCMGWTDEWKTMTTWDLADGVEPVLVLGDVGVHGDGVWWPCTLGADCSLPSLGADQPTHKYVMLQYNT